MHQTLVFHLLPEFAAFLKNKKLNELLMVQLQLSRKHDIPLLKLLPQLEDQQLIEMGRSPLIELLQSLEENKIDEYITSAIDRWVNNQLPNLKSEQIKADDITIINFVRKQSFIQFIPEYTTDTSEMFMIIREIDEFLMELETRFINIYLHVFQRSLSEHQRLNESIRVSQFKIEQELSENKNLLEKIADATPTVLFLFDLYQEKVIYINQEITAALGYLPEEIMEKPLLQLFEIYHPEDAARIPHRLEQYNISDIHQTEYECRLKHKNGKFRWALIREMVFKRNADGKVTSILGAGLDITDRKEMEDMLFQKTLELQQSNTSLEEFAYVASHDLQEPLRKISTFGDRLLSFHNTTLNDDGKLYLSKIIQSSLHMQRMINDLLSISIISSEKTFEETNLKLLCDEALQVLEHKIDEKKAKIIVGELPTAIVIPSQIRQLFQNLVSNSLKFSKPGEPPLVKISHELLTKSPVPYAHGTDNKQYHKISVEDNGIGFENKFAEKIFTIFQRLHSKQDYQGTGIGLAICKKIVENHNGHISAYSQLNSGTTFTIILPS